MADNIKKVTSSEDLENKEQENQEDEILKLADQ